MKNKVLIIGGGGREHALAWKFAQSLGWNNVFAVPGNAGISNSIAIDIQDFDQIENFCKQHHIDLIFVGPEQPLTNGIADYFKTSRIQVFGPGKQAAQLEGSKIFAKNFMKKYGVRTAGFQQFNHIDDAKKLIEEKQGNLVVKFDGLAGGKGVFVCSSVAEATEALHTLENTYGKKVKFLIEDKIDGDEVSVIGFTDGNTIKTLPISQDHKQLLDGDKGPNTGGMGAYCPVDLPPEISDDITQNIIRPTLKGIKSERMNYKGVIYFGLMIKDKKAYLLEYNVRFGDPETEVLLPALKTDLYEITQACLNGNLAETEFEFNPGYFVDVVLVSGGYPKKYEKRKEIKGLDKVSDDCLIFHAGTKKTGGKFFTDGGRVLNVVANGKTLDEAIEKAYREVEKISFEGMFYRKDIGKRANKELKI
jgi:phosphoribosylamine--glycine ligase